MRAMPRRIVVLCILIALALAVIAVAWRRPPRDESVRFTWVATAHQMGPVGYRDPVGAISPDGRFIAYSEGRFLRVRPIGGGPSIEFAPGDDQIRFLVWSPDSRTILANGFRGGAWAIYDLSSRAARVFHADRAFRQPTWSPDGKALAAVVTGQNGDELWTMPSDGAGGSGRHLAASLNSPAYTPSGVVACIVTAGGRPRLTIPCGETTITFDPDLDVYGPLAFSSDGRTVYFSAPNDGGTLDLWSASSRGGRAQRLTSFARDTYAPSIASDGTIVFKLQSYRTLVALASAAGGGVEPLATFQSETPSWDPTGRSIGITYGTWRRIVDDAHYPDIAQDAGIIDVDPARPATAPARVVQASVSEDQSLCWSPNGRYIAFHSHKDQSDDIWLRPSASDTPLTRVSFLGRGAETGWPRWSPDGRWVVFQGASPSTHRTVIYLVGIDQDTGATTSAVRELAVSGVAGSFGHNEWLPDSAHLVGIVKEGPGQHAIFTIDRDGGAAHVVHRFQSEHDAPGLAVSPDGRDVAFIAPASDGFFQLFRLPLAGGTPTQVTTDPANKTQPSWSPDGRRIALTVWSYDAMFLSMRAPTR